MDSDLHQLASLFPNISSQLRGALSNLHLAAAQLVPAREREADPELDAKAARLDQSFYQLLRLVNSLSAAAYLTNDDPLPLRDCDLVEEVSSLCEQAGSLAELLGLRLRFVCPMERHICAIAPDQLEQLVYHLLSNAFKFTPAGGTVTVELRLRREQVLLSVTDTGCGISDERVATLFDQYLHKDQPAPPPHGLGLGLALCRRIAEGHGGTLMAESKEGVGSKFTLCIPDRTLGRGLSDIPLDYSGGFNRTLMALADALPAKAFLIRQQD